MTDLEMIQDSIDILTAQMALVPKQRALQDAQLLKMRASQDTQQAAQLIQLQGALEKAKPAS